MAFGKRVDKENTPKKKGVKNVKKTENEEVVEIIVEQKIGESDVNNEKNNIENENKEESKIKKRKLNFKKKSSVNKNKMVMFGLSNEERIQLFKDNLVKKYPNIPNYFFEKEVEKFKKKLGE